MLIYHGALAWCAVLFFLFSSTAHALDLTDVFKDPLKTLPSTLTSGPVFPDGSPLLCPAEVNLSQPLKLKDVIGLALCNNPQIKQAWADIKIAAGQLGEAKSAYLPTASATFSPYQVSQVDYPDFPDNSTFKEGKMASGNLNWRLLDFGARASSHESTKLSLQSALASHEAIIQRAMQVVTQSYFEVLSNDANVNAKNSLARIAKSTWEATLRREAKGVSDKNDSLQAQSALAKARLAASRTAGDRAKSYADLMAITGLPLSSKIALQESPNITDTEELKDLEVWLNLALQAHPGIKAARFQWDAAKEKINASKSAGLPSLDFVASLYQNGMPNQGVQPTRSLTGSMGLTINIPVFDGFGTNYKVKGAQAIAEKAHAEFESAERQVLTEIVKSHADAVSSLANLDSSESLTEASSAAFSSAMKRYVNGASDVFELLNAQSALAQAQEERIRCILEWRSARLRLDASAGVLTQIKAMD